jgi:transcriptional regulator with XRE-family HTH domain
MRRSSGLTQAQLAALLGHPQSYVSKYESGERRLDIFEVRRLCVVMDVDLIQLAGAVDERLRT